MKYAWREKGGQKGWGLLEVPWLLPGASGRDPERVERVTTSGRQAEQNGQVEAAVEGVRLPRSHGQGMTGVSPP